MSKSKYRGNKCYGKAGLNPNPEGVCAFVRRMRRAHRAKLAAAAAKREGVLARRGGGV